MNCEYCGNPIPAGSPKCPSCGAVAPAPAPAPAPAAPQPVYYAQPPQVAAPAPASSTSRVAYILLAVFLGALGVHNFYAKRHALGAVQLLITLLSCGWLSVISWVWSLIEAVVVTTDGNGQRMS